MKSFFYLHLFFWLSAWSCDVNSTGLLTGPDGDSLILAEAFPELDFIRPVDLQNTSNNNLYVVEQRGVIKVFDNAPDVTQASVFLDIQERVDDSGNEEGLLGLAFHPGFPDNAYFYVNYTSPQGTTKVSRFEIEQGNPLAALEDSELVLLEFDQPFGNHNGGQLTFGPDGYLYIAVGDGGSGGDPQGHGQNLRTLLGSILRIDVNQNSSGTNYGIPAGNPFLGNTEGFRPEIFAYGLRNPWRFSFDAETGDLWAGDVGQNKFEEIDIIQSGGNYGWNITEGFTCYGEQNCNQTPLKAPYFDYAHGQGDVSITGGFVYRGPLASLKGYYIYADYASGRIWALQTQSANPQNTLLLDTDLGITSFGVDQQQELYFCSIGGKLYKISKYN